MDLSRDEVLSAVKAALAEDIQSGDVTTLATVSPDSISTARMVARETLRLSGVAFAETAFRELSPRVQIETRARDADSVIAGGVILELTGPTAALLSAERVALNFLQRLSGIATTTQQFVERVKNTKATILDTRKTIPGWRRFEKYAVECGGGKNHRFGLFDMVLIKDNHLAALRHEIPNAITAAVQRARKKYPKLKIEVEADTLEQVDQAVAAGADVVLLDNMELADLRQAVERVGGRAKTEASGGVTLGTVGAIADAGVDYISVGAITHSARAVDIGLDFEN